MATTQTVTSHPSTANTTTRIGFYPGCSLNGTASEYKTSVLSLAEAFGIKLDEVPDWSCCGATAAHNLNRELSLALPSRVLANAAEAGMNDILVPCASCYNRLAMTLHALQDETVRTDMEVLLEKPLDPDIRVINMIQFVQQYIQPHLDNKLKKPFFAKTACYYGCLLVRPNDVLQFDRAEDPQSMDEVMKTLGVGTIDWPFKTECCGAGLTMSRTDLVNKLSGKIVADAAERGAEAIVVACPMCHANLDMRGQQASDKYGQQAGGSDAKPIPILYLSQAIGMALGLDDKQTGLGHHLTPVKPERLCAAGGAKVAATAQKAPAAKAEPTAPAAQPEANVQPNHLKES